jgi:hypothetical protein
MHIFFLMEDEVNIWKMEDDQKKIVNGRWPKTQPETEDDQTPNLKNSKLKHWLWHCFEQPCTVLILLLINT